MYVEQHGRPNGTPIIFLHGSLVAGWMWMGQVEALPDHRCLLVDYPGIGHSGDDDWVSLADTADRVADVIREHGIDGSAHVVGLSLGGIIALHLALQHPAAVRSLLVSGVPYGPIPLLIRLLNRGLLGLYQRPVGARLVARIFGLPDDESIEAFVDTAAATKISALRSILDELDRTPLPGDLDGIPHRTLAVTGSRDTRLARDGVRFLGQNLPNCETRLAPGVRHQWNAEQPGLFTDMVRAWVDDAQIDERLVVAT